MEVVELVEISGQTHQVMENFEDLILTVVPEGQEGSALAAAGDGQRTIVVTEVRGPHGMEDQNNKIESLEARVEQLEDQVHFLEDELRIIRRKVVQGNPSNNYSTIRRTVLEVLSKQTMKISLSDFEDEMADSPEPVGRARPSYGHKRSRYENGFSDDEDEDYSEAEEETPVRTSKRRGPGRPPKSQAGFGRKPKTHRVELTPPPPKSNRPRGRPRRTVEVNQEEGVAATPTVEDKTEQVKPSAADDEEELAPENTTVEMETGESEEHDKDTVDEEAEEETAETTTTKATTVTKAVTPEGEGAKGTSPKKGRRRVAAEVAEPESTPVRVSTRARKISRKASD